MKKLISFILLTTFLCTSILGTYVFSAVYGDINGDGESNNKDVVTLFRYVSSGVKADDESAYDFNGDGEVNNKDVVALFRYLSNMEPGTTEEPEETEPEETEPVVTEPDETEPDVTEPDETEPEETEPVVTEPDETEPDVTEPEVTEPDETEPEETEPEVTEPDETEPEETEPEVTEPDETEPEVTESEVTEPYETEPEETEPEETEPEETEPEETEPEEVKCINAAFDELKYDDTVLCSEKAYLWVADPENSEALCFDQGAVSNIYLRGWAQLSTSIYCFGYLLDGVETSGVTFIQDRSAELTAAGYDGAQGFAVTVPVADLTPGEHTIEIIAVDADTQEPVNIVKVKNDVVYPVAISFTVIGVIETEPEDTEEPVYVEAMYSLDRIFVNQNDRPTGDAQFGVSVPDGSDIEITEGDSLYIIGWVINTETGSKLSKIVYTVDDGRNIDCAGGYRDRFDVANYFGLDSSAGENAGFGYDTVAYGGMLRLAGIEDLPEGEYEIVIKAIFEDGTVKEFDAPGNPGIFMLIVNPRVVETEPDETEPEETEYDGEKAYAKEFTVSKAIGKNMVIQRNEPIRIWGWAPSSENGKYVAAEFSGLTGEAKVSKGEWMITLDGTLPENTTAQEMHVYGDGAEYTFGNILVGDVYWVIGQSNIAYNVNSIINEPLACEESRSTANISNNYLIRLNRTSISGDFDGIKIGTNDVSEDVVNKRGWQLPKIGARAFSALGYFTALKLFNALDGTVPIGMIEFDGNGCAIHSFLPNEVRDALHVSTLGADGTYSAPDVNGNKSSFMYNHGMYSFQKMPISGVIWYQGESDYATANNNCTAYAERFTAFINYIRDKHDQINHDYPVYIVELSPSFRYNSNNEENAYIDFATVRMNMGSIPSMLNNAHICSTEDLWKDREYWNNLHPYNKWEIAERIKDIMLANAYNKGTIDNAEGPIVTSCTFSSDGKEAVIKFKNVGDGLKWYGDVKNGIKVLTSSSWTVPQSVEITAPDTITVKSSKAIRRVGYNNALDNTYPEKVTLCNSAGVPCAAWMFIR